MDEALEKLPACKQDVSIADVAVQDTRFVRQMVTCIIVTGSSVGGNTPIDLLTSNSITDTYHKLP